MKKSFLIGLLTIGLLITSVCCIASQDATQTQKAVQTVQQVVEKANPLAGLDWWKIITFIFGLGFIGATTIIGSLWSAVKEGKEAHEAYVNGKKDGWTEKEKDKYIKESGEFLDAIMNLKNVLKKKLLGIKKK